MKRCATQTETFPLAIRKRIQGGRRAHPRGPWMKLLRAETVQCQMLPTSAINPNTNLLFPLTKEERIEIRTRFFHFREIEAKFLELHYSLSFRNVRSEESMPNSKYFGYQRGTIFFAVSSPFNKIKITSLSSKFQKCTRVIITIF